MKSNRGGKLNLPNASLNSVEWMLKVYDHLPPKLRKWVREHPVNISIEPKVFSQLKRHSEELILQSYKEYSDKVMRQATIDTYGPDHPQVCNVPAKRQFP